MVLGEAVGRRNRSEIEILEMDDICFYVSGARSRIDSTSINKGGRLTLW